MSLRMMKVVKTLKSDYSRRGARNSRVFSKTSEGPLDASRKARESNMIKNDQTKFSPPADIWGQGWWFSSLSIHYTVLAWQSTSWTRYTVSSGISAECLCRRLSFAQFQEGDDGDGCSLQPAGGGQLHVVVNPPSPVDVVTADDATTEEVQGYYTVDICCSNVYCSTLGKYIVYIFICPEIVKQIFYLLYFVLKNCQYLILLVLKPPILHWSWGGSLIEFKGFQEKGQSVVSQYIAMAIFSHNPTTPPNNPPKPLKLLTGPNWSTFMGWVFNWI